MNSDRIQRIADKIKAELAPLCEKIAIAGSLRRERPIINDIDLVILPKDKAAIKTRCSHRCYLVTDGNENCMYRLSNGLQLDLFFARGAINDMFNPQPCNWGTILLQRTGSREHNIWICDRARALGIQWKPYIGLVDADGYVIASETEQSIYEFIGLPMLMPKQREIDWLIKHFGPAGQPRFRSSSGTGSRPASAPTPTPASDPDAAVKALADFRAAKESMFGK